MTVVTREQDRLARYSYTGLGELSSVLRPDGQRIDYTYDANGLRVAKAIDGRIVERYSWADNTRLLATYDGAGALTRRFLYADARTPYAMDTPAGRRYLAYDQVGSVRALTDESGRVVGTLVHDSFGMVVEQSGEATSAGLGFAAGLSDPDTGLVLFGARDYDPASGRWMAKDPIGFAGGDVNLYGYCLGDPVNLVDPWGLAAAEAYASLSGTAAIGTGIAALDGLAPVGDVVAVVFVAGGLLGAALILAIPAEAFEPRSLNESRAKEQPSNYVVVNVKAEAMRLNRDPCDVLNEWLATAKSDLKSTRNSADARELRQYVRDVQQAQKFLCDRNRSKRGR